MTGWHILELVLGLLVFALAFWNLNTFLKARRNGWNGLSWASALTFLWCVGFGVYDLWAAFK